MQTSHLNCDYDNTSAGLQLLLGELFTVIKWLIWLLWAPSPPKNVQTVLLIYLLLIIVGNNLAIILRNVHLAFTLEYLHVCGVT